jgi:hypothetical protein
LAKFRIAAAPQHDVLRQLGEKPNLPSATRPLTVQQKSGA